MIDTAALDKAVGIPIKMLPETSHPEPEIRRGGREVARPWLTELEAEPPREVRGLIFDCDGPAYDKAGHISAVAAVARREAGRRKPAVASGGYHAVADMKHLKWILPATLVVGTMLWLASTARGSGGAAAYIPRLLHRVGQWRAALPALQTTAKQAASKVIHGGHLYVAGGQQSFVAEAVGRSGGLMLIKSYHPGTVLGPKDTVLAAAARPTPGPALTRLLLKAREAHSVVIFFTGIPPANPPVRFAAVYPRSTAPGTWKSGRPSIRTTSVSNVIGMWAWTAEFITACVDDGRMPNMYQSYGRPGGRARDAKLMGAAFQQRSTVTPASAANLGQRYLTGVAVALRQVWRHDRRGLWRAARWIRAAHRSGHTIDVLYEAHMFPAEMRNGPTPPWFQSAHPPVPSGPGDTALVLGYQLFNEPPIDSILRGGGACILTCSVPPPASFTTNPRHIYLNPYWAVDDALLKLKGYDVKVLPISGIMQSAIYWQLVEMVETRRHTAHGY